MSDHWPNNRYEMKYFLPQGAEDDVRQMIQPHVVHDPHARDGSGYRYIVSSLYFDTPFLDYYYEKLDGVKMRKKVRIRCYDPESLPERAFLEIKRRFNNKIYKERCPMNTQLLPAVIDEADGTDFSAALPHARRRTLSRFHYLIRMDDLHPTILIAYDREAFVGRDDDRIRVTLDLDVRSRLCNGIDDFQGWREMKRIIPRGTILELKFDDRMPFWLVRMVRKLGLRAQSISKYCHAIEAWHGLPG
jgi:SPX domain protein involved in polyphosphate accumulation